MYMIAISPQHDPYFIILCYGIGATPPPLVFGVETSNGGVMILHT